jgi:hypothetical protein
MTNEEFISEKENLRNKFPVGTFVTIKGFWNKSKVCYGVISESEHPHYNTLMVIRFNGTITPEYGYHLSRVIQN